MIVELKTVKVLGAVDRAQVLNYLKASGLSRALLVNFATPRLEYERLVFSRRTTPPDEQQNGGAA